MGKDTERPKHSVGGNWQAAEHKKGSCHQNSSVLKGKIRGVWVARSVKRPTSAPVMISLSVSSSLASGSVPTAQSLECALDSVSPSLSSPPLLMLCLSHSQK